MRRAAMFLVTVERAASDEIVHERVFMTEAEAKEWIRPFVRDGFRCSLQRFRRDSGYSNAV
jgi:hypothetical protein